MCYEQASTLVTSNLPFNEWTEIFGSERLTGALLDRLTHHVHILELNGESYRLEHSKKARQPAAAPVYRLRVLGQWFDGIRFYAAASSPRRSRRTWAGLR